VPTRNGKIVHHDHRSERIGNLVKRWKLGELLGMADPGNRNGLQNLKEWQSESLGDAVRESLSEAVRPARMTTGNARDRAGRCVAAQLPD